MPGVGGELGELLQMAPAPSRKPMFSRFEPYGVWDAWGVGLLPHPGTGAEGRASQKAPLPAILPGQLPSGPSCHPLKHLLREEFLSQCRQCPPPDAPTPKVALGLFASTSLQFKPAGVWLLHSSGAHPHLCIPTALSSLRSPCLAYLPPAPSLHPKHPKFLDWCGLSVVTCLKF